MGFVNYVADTRGIQIGLINKTRRLNGVQLGIWNQNEKRSLPIVNWNFKETTK
ncbi:MAG: LA_2272 family surface repeat-containing protein [Bacteroidales bacterium]